MQELLFLKLWRKTSNVDQVLLHHSQTSEVLSTEAVRFGFLLLLQLGLLCLLLFLHLSGLMYSCLFGGDDLVFDVLVVVRSSTRGTQAVHVVLDIVVAELTYLQQSVRSVAEWRNQYVGEKDIPGSRKDMA